jgi:hypothetical protein
MTRYSRYTVAKFFWKWVKKSQEHLSEQYFFENITFVFIIV